MDVVERVSDRIVILNEGRIVADGSFEELRARLQESSLERIFSQLTSEGEQAAVAGKLLRVIQE
jgi:ABC-2 type transport system ATP-binding protein